MGNDGHTTVWTEPMLDYLAARFNDGAQTVDLIDGILRTFGHKVTRNAISGRIFRLRKLPGVITRAPVSINAGAVAAKKQNARAKSRERKQKQRAALRSHPAPVLVAQPVEVVVPLSVTLLDLQRGCCAYPYGSGGDVRFCGHPTAVRNYCQAHYDLCHKEYRPDPAVTARRSRTWMSLPAQPPADVRWGLGGGWKVER